MKRLSVFVSLLLALAVALSSLPASAFSAQAQRPEIIEGRDQTKQFGKSDLKFLRQMFDANAPGATRAELDRTNAILIGKAGYYQLRDIEGGFDFNGRGQLEPYGRKTFAVISGVPLQRDEFGGLKSEQVFDPLTGQFVTRYFFARDFEGRILVNLFVMRDPRRCDALNGCGHFDRENVPFTSGRQPGEFDTIQTMDLVGL